MNINNYTVSASVLDYKTISIIKKYFSISNKVEMSIGIYQKGETKVSDDNLYYIYLTSDFHRRYMTWPSYIEKRIHNKQIRLVFYLCLFVKSQFRDKSLIF